MASAFKSEKEFQAWLAKNPSAAARVQEAQTAKHVEARGSTSDQARARVIVDDAGAVRKSVALATSDGVAVIARLPGRGTRLRPVRTLRQRFAVAMAWLFVVQVGLSTLGAFGCLCGILALEYVR